MYKLEFEKGLWKTVEKIAGKDKKLWSRIELAINRLKQDPYNPSLRTHKVNTRRYGEKRSSRITGDLRLIWDFDEHNRLVILVLDLGGHSGKDGAYK